MTKIIGIVLEIVWSIIKGVAKQNEQERKKRDKLKKEAAAAWESSSTRRNVDRMWSKLRG